MSHNFELYCLYSQLYQFGLRSSTFQNSSDLDTRNESEALPSMFPKQSFQIKQQNLPRVDHKDTKSLTTLFSELSFPSRAFNFTFPVHSPVKKGAILNLHKGLGKGSRWLPAGKGQIREFSKGQKSYPSCSVSMFGARVSNL